MHTRHFLHHHWADNAADFSKSPMHHVVCLKSLISDLIQGTFFTVIGQTTQLISANVSGSQLTLHLEEGNEADTCKAEAMQRNEDCTSHYIWMLPLSTHTPSRSEQSAVTLEPLMLCVRDFVCAPIAGQVIHEKHRTVASSMFIQCIVNTLVSCVLATTDTAISVWFCKNPSSKSTCVSSMCN